MRRKTIFIGAVLASTVVLTGLGSAANAGAKANAGTNATAIPTTSPCGQLPPTSAPTVFDHVALIIFENKPLNKIVGNTADAPYLNSLIRACSYSKNDLSLSTTSLTNYIALTSGYTGCTAVDNAGRCTSPKVITSNSPPSTWPQASRSIFELMGGQAREWAESMPGPCTLVDKSTDFVINHSPYQYYTNTQQTLCPANALPFPSAPADTLSARFNLIIPNKKNIMHLVPNSTVSTRIRNGDNWAKGFVPQLLASPQYQSGTSAIIITWDEGNNSQFLVPLIVITPYTRALGVSSVPYNHYSVLKGIQQLVGYGSPLLGHAADPGVTSIRDDAVFGLKP